MPHAPFERLQFVIPECDDRVDPGFDFKLDEYSKGRTNPQIDDVYAHELLGQPTMDGLLVTRSNVTPKKLEKIKQVGGIHSYLRAPKGIFTMGDCGAVQNIDKPDPRYTCEEICSYYEDLGFDYGISLDHIIKEFDEEYDAGSSLLSKEPTEDMRRRQQITIENAIEMQQICQTRGCKFTLLGAVQGWSPNSYKEGALQLIAKGFDYLALGGLKNATDKQILSVLEKLHPHLIKNNTKVHVLGVARIGLLPDYVSSQVASCDSATSFRQAFHSQKDNYHTHEKKYTAVRIRPVSGNPSNKVNSLLKAEKDTKGEVAAQKLYSKLVELEQKALKAIRAYAERELNLEKTMAALRAYEDALGDSNSYSSAYEETLKDRPWETCPCAICKKIGVEVIILRRNDRNRRRAFHNTFIFYEQFKALAATLSSSQ